MSDKDGGPAFARPAGDYNGTKNGNGANRGMSLRDYFAAKAMMMFVNDLNPRQAAEMAYQYADEMIGLRAKEPT